jgi:hypothetical protein
MINFFRRFRKSLLESNSFRKYVLYALGEILLVVVGILIALAINNANLEQKNRKLEQQYLIALRDEYQVNINKLDILDTLLAVQLEASQAYVQHMHPDQSTIDGAQFAKLMANGFKDTYCFLPSSGVLKDLINSGKLGLIKNAELRRILADWDALTNYIKQFEDEGKMASYQVVELLRTDGSFREHMNMEFKALGTGPSSFVGSNTSLLKNKVFENSVVYFTAVTWRLKNVFYPELKNKMKNVVKIINNEIDK